MFSQIKMVFEINFLKNPAVFCHAISPVWQYKIGSSILSLDKSYCWSKNTKKNMS